MIFLGILFPIGARDPPMNLYVAVVLEMTSDIDMNHSHSAADSDQPKCFCNTSHKKHKRLRDNRLSHNVSISKCPRPPGRCLDATFSFLRAPSVMIGTFEIMVYSKSESSPSYCKRNVKSFKIFKYGVNCGMYIGIDKSN